jgi:2-dehydropantoate 2-reductase
MKICTVGLGAVGGWLTARLLQLQQASENPSGQGLQISALARGATLAAVQQHGLVVHNATAGAPTSTVSLPLRASSNADELGVQDLVIVAVKAPALAAAAPSIARLCGPHTQVLAAMNGVPWWFFDGLPGPCQGLVLNSTDPGGVLHRLLPSQQVLGCVVHLSSTAPAPGQVQHKGGDGLVIGHAILPQPSPNNQTEGGVLQHSVLQRVCQLFSAAGFAVTASPHIQRDVWFKLWGNMTMNPVSALTGAPSDRLLADPLVRGFMTAVMQEAQAIGAAFGIAIDQTPEARHAVTAALGSFKTSMLQDVQAGRPLEIDALVGAVQEIGVHLGQRTPHINALLGLVRLMARERGLYPAA